MGWRSSGGRRPEAAGWEPLPSTLRHRCPFLAEQSSGHGEPANVVCRLLTIAPQAQDQAKFGARTEKLCEFSGEQLFCCKCTGGCYLVAKSCPTRCDSMQAPVSMRFPRRGFWSGLPFPSPGHLPYLGITLVSFIGRQVLCCWATWEVYKCTSPPSPSSNNLDWLLVSLNSSKMTSSDPGAGSLQSDITPQL